MVWLGVQGKQSLSSQAKAGIESDWVAPNAQLYVSRWQNMRWGYNSKEKDLKFIELSAFLVGGSMNLYTSYWAQVRNFPQDLVGLNTTIWPPKWRPLGEDKRGVIVVDCPPLKPGQECEGLCYGKGCTKRPNYCDFLLTYERQLSQIDFQDFLKHLEKLKAEICKDKGLEDVDFAFIFFETPQNPCSERSAVSDWVSRNGVAISEWKIN